MRATTRHNVQQHGPADGPPMVFAHGFGCDQNMWRHVWPAFADDHRVVLLDHVGHGRSPERFSRLVMVGPSPRYVDDDDDTGGFSRAVIDDLLDSLESNYLGWSSAMAPVIMGNEDRPELGAELTDTFCATDPAIARHFARVTSLSDNREDLPRVPVRSLV